MKQIGIYKITSPSKKIYIGQSIDIEKRWKYYKRLDCKSQFRLYNSFIKYGVHKHKFEILQLCDENQLNELEKYYVELFQVFNNKYGLNLQNGGNSKIRHSEETKLKIGLGNKGKFVSNETKLKLSLAKQNMSIETRQKMSLAKLNMSDDKKSKMKLINVGRKHSAEHIEKNRLCHIGLKRSDETKMKLSILSKNNINAKKALEILSLSRKKLILNTETGIFYLGIEEAANAHCITKAVLNNKLIGRTINNTNLIYV